MKAVFPDKGIMIVTKYSIDLLKNFYMNNLVNSKLFPIYKQSNCVVQSGNFNYFPQKSSFILEKADLLTMKQLKEIVASQTDTKPISTPENKQDISEEPLDDNFIKTNPFFKTLTNAEN